MLWFSDAICTAYGDDDEAHVCMLTVHYSSPHICACGSVRE